MSDLSAFPISRRWPAVHPDRIQLYSLNTPNGVKVSIMLEETGLPYEAHLVDIMKDESHTPEFLSLNPNGKIPAILDPDGPGGQPLALFESGAILLYLADKTGRLIGRDAAGRYRVIQWVMFQMANVGPMFGQANHFLNKAPDKLPYAVDRYVKEASRLFTVMDRRLGEAEYLAGDYSIADIATYVWVRNPKHEGQNIDDYPNVKRWFQAIDARPAVQRAHRAVEEAGKQHAARTQVA